jgi:hypothetical protein
LFPMKKTRKRPSLRWYAANRVRFEERFAERIDIRRNGCWQWTGRTIGRSMYPVLNTGYPNPRIVGARIVSWYLTHRELVGRDECPWPAYCRNGLCVAPDHLVRCYRSEVMYLQGATTLSPGDVLEICRRADKGHETLTAIADQYGVAQEQVSMIVHGKRWMYLTRGRTKR